MSATILRFPERRFSTCTGSPSPAVARLAADTTELIQIDQALAAVEELAVLAADRLDALPFGSERWSWELECWVGLIAERLDLEQMRERALSGGLRLVTGCAE